jgi:hypothetical protein
VFLRRVCGGLGGGNSVAGSFGRKMHAVSSRSAEWISWKVKGENKTPKHNAIPVSAMASRNASKRKSTIASPLTSMNSSPGCKILCAGPVGSTVSTNLALQRKTVSHKEKKIIKIKKYTKQIFFKKTARTGPQDAIFRRR